MFRYCAILVLFPLAAQAADPLRSLRSLCPEIAEKQARAQAECPELNERAVDARGACMAMHSAYDKAARDARLLAKEARAWIKKNGVVRDNHTSVTVLMDLSADPGYPLQSTNIDRITNDAITVGYESLTDLEEKIGDTGCTGPAYQAWEAAIRGDATSLNRLHTENAMAVGDLLLKEKRVIESGAHDRAGKELRGSGVSIRPTR